jgi:hypothetical protein
MIHYNDLILLVLIIEKLRNELISLDVGARVINCLLDMVLFIFIRLSEVEEKKLSIDTDW